MAAIFEAPPQTGLAVVVGVAAGAICTTFILAVAKRFDPTNGTLTISVMIVLAMMGATAYCLIFTIPTDDITPGVVGGLTAGFGAVVAHWLGRTRDSPPPGSD
jgi:hypothetical protein